ncbi:MAG TPA: glycosyltransferase family 4 protein [Spirochaetia bacterium]|nr:glycosyltransferase family 4 protein [Spirochaetia bacterium]
MKNNNNNHFRIAFVSGKLGDVDGVSLEVDKWISILTEMGHEVYTIAGKYGTTLKSIPEENQILFEKIRFGSPEQHNYETHFFPHLYRFPPHHSWEKRTEVLENLEAEGTEVANQLLEKLQRHNIDVLVAQNTNAMPMTLLGGMGIYKLATEQRIATIFHHHDFWWERSRFSSNHIEQLLGQIMPPVAPGLEHIVLSSYAAHILSSIKRVAPIVVPNCEDFDRAVVKDDYNTDFRQELGFKETDILVVQPTRIVRRKRIQDSVELVGRLLAKYPSLSDRVKFVVSLYQGDEPDENYEEEITRLANQRGVSLHLISERIASERTNDSQGRKLYTNRDVLANADIVTYLPIWEGFGNALLEAIAAKVPVVTTAYLVYKTDIKLSGFDNIEIRDNYDDEGRLIIPERIVDEMYRVITNREVRATMVEKNFRIGKREFGFKTLRSKLDFVLNDYGDEIRASRKRIEKGKLPYSV